MLLAVASDLDDLIPTLVAYQIEWNKLRVRCAPPAGRRTTSPTPDECAEALGGTEEDWARLREAWGDGLRRAPAAMVARAAHEPAGADARRHAGRLRAA